MLRRTDIRPNAVLCDTSRTTTAWPLVVRLGRETLVGDRVGHQAGTIIVRPVREPTYEELVDEVIAEHAEAMSRLAAL